MQNPHQLKCFRRLNLPNSIIRAIADPSEGAILTNETDLYILAVLDLLHHQEILLVIAFKLHQPRSALRFMSVRKKFVNFW